jgi:hypothetical protein
MKLLSMTWLLAALILQFSVVNDACAEHPGQEPPPVQNCISSLHIARGESPWRGMTDNYEQEQANKNIQAAAVDTALYTPLPSLSLFDRPDMLLGRSEKPKAVVVNKLYFSDLRRGDATRIGKGEKLHIGNFLDIGFKRLAPRDLAKFLITAQIIETYWHLEADICQTGEEDGPDIYRATFSGLHKYCTNRCVKKREDFQLLIDKRNGAIHLKGGEPNPLLLPLSQK